MTTANVWFRRDLRIADHPALHHALASGLGIVPVYIHAPEEDAPWPAGAASRWWLHYSLDALGESLARLGSRLVIRRGPAAESLHALAQQAGAQHVHFNRALEPAAQRRDRVIAKQLRARGIACHSWPGNLLHEPGSVLSRAGEPYKVFTPFRRACMQQPALQTPLPSASGLPPVAMHVASLTVEDLRLLPDKPWQYGLAEAWQPGETAAHQRLHAFCQSSLALYPQWRDFPDRSGTSRLSRTCISAR